MAFSNSALTSIKNYTWSAANSVYNRLPARETMNGIVATSLNFGTTIRQGVTSLGQRVAHAVTHPSETAAQGVAAYKTAKVWMTPAEQVPIPLRPARPDPLKDLPLEKLRAESDIQRKTFVRTITAFATIKTVYETICGMGTASNPEFYNVLLDQTSALSDKEFHAEIKKRFFPWIEESSNNIITKLFAKLCFVLMVPIMESISNSISSRVFADIRASIDSDTINGCENIGNRHLANINGYLQELCDAYEPLKTSPKTGEIDPIIQQKLEQGRKKLAERAGLNNFSTQAGLNERFIKEFLTAYPYKFTLDEMVESFLDHIKFPEDSIFCIFNPVLRLAVFIASWIAWTLLHYPQKLANHALSSILKQILVQTDIIGAVMGGVAESVRAPEFQHTLHTSLSDLLNDLGHILHNPSEPTPAATVRLKNIDLIVKRAFALLGFNQVKRIEELKKLAAGEPPYAPLFLEATVNDAIVEAATDLVPSAFEQLVEPRQLEKIFLTSLTSLNTLFDVPPKSPSLEKIKEAEREVIELKDQIISFIVRDVLKTITTTALTAKQKTHWWTNLIPNFVPRLLDKVVNWNGPQKMLHDRVHAIVKGRTDAIFNAFLFKPYHYTEGLNRLVLLPFIRAKAKKTTQSSPSPSKGVA